MQKTATCRAAWVEAKLTAKVHATVECTVSFERAARISNRRIRYNEHRVLPNCPAQKTSKWALPWGGAKLLCRSPMVFGTRYFFGGCQGKTSDVEKLWQEFFSDPTKWRDHRLDKATPRFPDFKHKYTEKALWVNSQWSPPWVKARVAAIPPGTVEASNFSWNQRLWRYARAGQYEETMELFHEMQRDGMTVDRFTFLPVLKACASLGLLEHGRRIHTEIIQPAFEADLFVGSSLVDMYAKCGSIEDAWRVFSQIPKRDVVIWTAMIVGFAKCGKGQKALELFEQMQGEGLTPSRVTFVGVLTACASLAALEEGRRAHEEIVLRGYESDVAVGNSLVNMYVKCGSTEDAWRVFNHMPKRDVVTWTAMVLALVKCGKGRKALELFEQMYREGLPPSPVTFVGVLNACASVAALEEGRRAHEEIIQRGHESIAAVGNSLVDMYAKCGSIKEAETVFNQMSTRNVVAWTAMIVGYVKCGEGQKALDLFEQMKLEGVTPSPITFVGILTACASVAALEEGRHAHKEILQRGYQSNIFVGCCLVDMYAKCGSIEDAERVFNYMPKRDAVAWTAMITGYGSHGYTKEALETFRQMCEEVEVNRVTFISILLACSHGGLVDEGLNYFKSMNSVYNIMPTLDHYACVMDLLGRAGRLCEAEDLIRGMPVEPDAAIWLSLLGACGLHGNVEIGECAAKNVLALDPDNTGAYVLLSNIYTAAGHSDKSARVNEERLRSGVKPTLGRTCIEVNNKVHSFVADDNVHPQIVEIHAEIKRLSRQMKDLDFVPDALDIRWLDSVDEESKYFHLGCHSEKLAMAFGLISTAPGTSIRVVKNVRLCSNCHTATKFITKMVGRQIIVRDAKRLHYFQTGLCSCLDYW